MKSPLTFTYKIIFSRIKSCITVSCKLRLVLNFRQTRPSSASFIGFAPPILRLASSSTEDGSHETAHVADKKSVPIEVHSRLRSRATIVSAHPSQFSHFLRINASPESLRIVSGIVVGHLMYDSSCFIGEYHTWFLFVDQHLSNTPLE